MPVAEDLKDRLAPWLNEDMELLLEAVAQMTEPLASIIEDGWAPILSPAAFPNSEDFTRPAYPRRFNPAYLAQFVGVTVPTQSAYEQAISLIEEEPGLKRCTSEAIAKAVKRALKPGAEAHILSRQNANGEPGGYWFVVLIRGEDVEGSIVTTGNVASGSPKIKSIPSTFGIVAGDSIITLGVPPTVTVKEVNGPTELTLTANATVTAEGVPVVAVNQAGLTAVENNLAEAAPGGLLWWLLWRGTYKEPETGYASYKAAEEAFASYSVLELNG